MPQVPEYTSQPGAPFYAFDEDADFNSIMHPDHCLDRFSR